MGLPSMLRALIVLLPIQVLAAEPVSVHGLAMHGQPQLQPGFSHFPYANLQAPKGGRLVVGQLGAFDSLNPFVVIGVAPDAAPRFVLQSLMTRSADEPFTLYPLLARQVDVAPDRSFIRFSIDPRARFSDDRPVTAQDVLFSFEALKLHGKPFHRNALGRVKSVTIAEGNSIRFDLGSGQDRELPLVIATMPIFASHTLDLENFKNPSLKPLIGSGPYVFADVRPGERIALKRRDDFWARDLPVMRGLHNFDEIRYDYYRDANTLFEAFKTGLVDYRIEPDPGRWASGYDFPRLLSGQVRREAVPNLLPKGMTGLVFNTRRPLFQDRNVREALAMMFDFDWVNRNLYHGLLKRSSSYFDGADLSARDQPADAQERALLMPFGEDLRDGVLDGRLDFPAHDGSGRDREAARRALDLLARSGWQLEGDVLRRNGERFSFEMLATTRQQERLMLNVAQSLARIGVEARVRLLDDAQFWRRLSQFEFDMIQWTWPVSPSPGNEQRNRWASASATRPGSLNYAGVRSRAVDIVIDAMLRAETREDFSAAVRALDRLLVSGVYVIPLFHAGETWLAYDAGLVRPEKTPLFGPSLELWWRKQQ